MDNCRSSQSSQSEQTPPDNQAKGRAGQPGQQPEYRYGDQPEYRYGGKTEAEFLAATEHVVRVLAKDFTFGYYDQDDIGQQIRLFALERMPQYDGERDLANYLYVAVKRRLLNLVRDKFKRSDSPCKSCHAGRPCADADAAAGACERYSKWAMLQCRKSSLVQPVHWSDCIDRRHADMNSVSPADEAANSELLRMVDAALPAELRADYARWRDGVKLPRKREASLMHALRSIVHADPEANAEASLNPNDDSDGDDLDE